MTDQYTVHLRLEHKPNLGYVYKRGVYVQMTPTTWYTPEVLAAMKTYTVPYRKYNYIYALGDSFRTLEELEDYINS